MRRIHLGFKAFDCHELLCHAMAQSAGLYTDNGLTVELLDTTYVPDDAMPENSFHVNCGAALNSFLRGMKRKVVFIACDRPMYWLYSSREVASINDLGQARVASFPDASPPAQFLRRLLAENGASCGLLPSRDDVARLGLLTSHSVNAALLSSLHLPHEIESLDLKTLAFVGEKMRLPSSGLSLSEETAEREPELVATMIDIFQLSMRAIYEDDALLAHVLYGTFSMKKEGMEQAIQTVRKCYNRSCFSDDNLLQGAVDYVAKNLGLKSRPATALYDFKYLKSQH